ncbi:MAG TPA: EF-P beta-lysylation protein EpmB [Steroidobacteraceae bacterium]|nr:EF-P beta-lysylation protein EpmB [Steroidobacteraceae bacterium]
MIAAEPHTRHTAALSDLKQPAWQQELAAAVRDPLELLGLLDLTPGQIAPGETAESLRAAAAGFALRVPRAYVARMRRGDPLDPLLRQVLPVGAETVPAPGFVEDPLEERSARAVPGLLHKYQGRALMVTTGACAVHCRYCFRRHYDYGADQDADALHRWSAALAHVAGDGSIEEVILSGGDPLSLGNARLAQLLLRIREIPHVRRVRIHTRTPVVLPSRVDAGLMAALQPLAAELAIVIHANHPAELDAGTSEALRRLGSGCAALLNQSVLLAGINDDADVLALLSERLFEAGVLPYYLHQLDAVAGAAHHAVDDARARAIHAALAGTLPGYLLPRLVREIPGASGKTPLR